MTTITTGMAVLMIGLLGAGPARAEAAGAGQTLAWLGSARSSALAADAAAGEGLDGMAVNPASLAGQRRTAAAGTYFAGLAGTRVGQVAVALASTAGTLALSVGALDAGQVEMEDAGGAARAVDAQRDTVATLGFGRRLGAGVEAGATVTYLRSALAEAWQAQTWSGDAGLRWTAVDGSFSLGAAVSHIGAGLAYADARVALPRVVRTGAAWRPVRTRALAVVFAADYSAASTGPDALSAGAELLGLGVLAIRAGVTSAAGVATAGAGLGLRLGRMQFDYALAAPARMTPVSRATFTVAL